jgi:hypothetical protein
VRKSLIDTRHEWSLSRRTNAFQTDIMVLQGKLYAIINHSERN